ncbi:MAG: saccharopine dehydrogenase NADP-binding domain-containing protein [Deltaproteobacteria bacterium]|jgi:saccharopine dehydrogenase (NADP+, L-glutamate forming)|nr:saccharopine dehydrogenase NADP-binding domain-containing protein [Deltaproteobacteria bacterium]MBW2239060.1 saccharopine dehydrogenase NADP-binding domain-containing protein [Deltaproteobacteria bacterium]MBW2572631.1 saccharopine dehydrogenase NADP-binding domain-containing protein [Deltaproteobacteria bacterium]MBW2670346.1 saccharopine dehydrogenase NADP-binding domain-containing protein [Deltaproteobacteria bacterium]NOQ20414.1 saccharopine dehydrogenase [Desulfobacterales bacterium]
MKRVAVLGAGFVTKPAVDYFIDRCGYEVIVTSLKKSEAEKIIGGRPSGKAFALSIDQIDLLDQLVSEVDLVMSMIPPLMHIPVAQACLKHRKNMVTTSYISSEMEALDEFCQERGILILNEIGEDPGLDNMGSKRLIDQARASGGKVTSVLSYGAGLPAFEHNNNPMGYKFSWSPKGIILAAQAPAAYLKNGEKVEVPARALFDHHWLVNLEGVGSFETYPNRDCTQYLKSFELTNDVSFFRGILRYIGWCNTMKGLSDLQLLDTTDEIDFADTTYAEFTAKLIGADSPENILQKTARFFNIRDNSDLIKKLKWLGFFNDQRIDIIKGTNADILVDMMLRKMSYGPQEKDMVIIHTEVLAEYSNHEEKQTSTLLVKGEPGGDSAMSKAVSLPAAIASRLIIEGKIKAKGVRRPTLRAIYQPVLDEMSSFGYRFQDKTIKTDRTVP